MYRMSMALHEKMSGLYKIAGILSNRFHVSFVFICRNKRIINLLTNAEI